jgi:hypothetical protein
MIDYNQLLKPPANISEVRCKPTINKGESFCDMRRNLKWRGRQRLASPEETVNCKLCLEVEEKLKNV